MKIPASRRASGFTLVELLVVIAIIAVLAAAGFAAGNAAIQKARKTTALASAVSLESAVNNFFNEYGSMPTTQTSDTTENTKTSTTLLRILLGTDTTINTRGVKFLAAKEGKANKNGLIYDTGGSSVKGLYDPWGGGFFVLMDGNYDEKITVPGTVQGGGKTLNGRRAAVWSLGADGTTGSGGKAADDVVTW